MNRRQFALAALAAPVLRGQSLPMVRLRRKPTDEWKAYPTRTLDRVAGFQPGARTVPLDQYGGRTDRKEKATGFFYPKKLGGRWYLVDPEGRPYLQAGVCSLSKGNSDVNRAALTERFGTPERWSRADQRPAAREFLHRVRRVERCRPAARRAPPDCVLLDEQFHG